jgi:hypothetical protein
MTAYLDEDAVAACADLVGRTGAKQLQIGHVHEGVPVEQAGWFAHAQYRGARITVESHIGPAEAADALSRRLLTGAQCFHCKGLVALSDGGAMAYNATLVDGREWTVEQARAAGQCRWRRLGARWVRGCEPDGLVAQIEQALRDNDVERVPALIMQLALQDAERAQQMLDTINVGVTLSRQQQRNLRRRTGRGPRR